jgi:hypothetical protein
LPLPGDGPAALAYGFLDISLPCRDDSKGNSRLRGAHRGALGSVEVGAGADDLMGQVPGQLVLDRITTFRDCLREDPTLALAQMLLETPAEVSRETLDTMQSVATLVAAHAPGAEAVAIAQLLRDFTATLKPDAKVFIIERLCEVLVAFGGAEPAKQIRSMLQSED